MWEQEREEKPPVYKLDNLAVGLTQLRNENILCDLLIHLNDGSTVWAHKAVVCAVSPYILQLCQAEQSKSQSVIYINLNHVNVTNESLHLIVNYMYGCEIVVSSENLQDMRALANVLQLEDLKESLSENFNVEDHDEATQHEKASAYNEASGLSTSIKVEPCEDIQDTSNNIISLSPNIERDYNKNNSTNHTDFDIKLNDADDMDDAEADDYDDSVGDIETPTKRRKKSIKKKGPLSHAEISPPDGPMPELDSSNISLATASKLTKRNSKMNNVDFSKFVKTGDKRYKCLICHAETMFKCSIIRHLIRHDKQKHCLECPICFQKDFIYPKELENHIKVEHRGIKPVCEECGMQFKSTFTLKRHIRSIHKNGGKDIICDECGKHYQRRDSFLDHQRKHHQGATLPCVTCNKGFANASNKRRHEAICGKTLGVVCEICSKVFKSRKTCNRHIKDVHTCFQPQLHTCNDCAATFKHRKNMLRHGRMKGHNIDKTIE